MDGEVASDMHYLEFLQLTFQTGKGFTALFVIFDAQDRRKQLNGLRAG